MNQVLEFSWILLPHCVGVITTAQLDLTNPELQSKQFVEGNWVN